MVGQTSAIITQALDCFTKVSIGSLGIAVKWQMGADTGYTKFKKQGTAI